MCGISGLINCNQNFTKSLIGMTRKLAHRGPDDEGFLILDSGKNYHLASSHTNPDSVDFHSLGSSKIESFSPIEPIIGLGHRRLSIVDLSPNGHQPMSRNNTTWLVFNGEIFNYIELRKELAKLGLVFKTDTDTEVILAAYETWGLKCFEKFNGMWGLAILDLEKRQVHLCRDRYGIKPLYYRNSEGSFSFASEIKAFTALPDWCARANEAVIHDYLFKSLLDHSEETFFIGVRHVLPGHYITIDIDEKIVRDPRQIAWYNLPFKDTSDSPVNEVSQFKQLFLDSVKLRMRSDVKIGSCLSGGLDSSSIVGAMRALAPESRIETITACSKHKQFDESLYAEMVTNFTDSNSSKIFPDAKKLSKIIDKIIWHQDEPFCSASIFAQWCVFEKAKHLGIQVLLDGQGADETHCGYNSYIRPYVIGPLKQKNLRSLWKNLKLIRQNRRKVIGSILRGLLDCYIPTFINDLIAARKERIKKKGWYFGRKRIIDSYSLAREKNLKEHSKFMIQHGMRMLLHWEDRNSMAHSVESRVPFLDYRILPLLASLSDQQRVEGGWSKSIIRKSMHGLLPDEVIYRKDKMGFVTAESIWAKYECKNLYLKELDEISKHWGELIGPKIKNSYEKFLRGEKAYDPIFWKILCLNRWRSVFNVKL